MIEDERDNECNNTWKDKIGNNRTFQHAREVSGEREKRREVRKEERKRLGGRKRKRTKRSKCITLHTTLSYSHSLFLSIPDTTPRARSHAMIECCALFVQ